MENKFLRYIKCFLIASDGGGYIYVGHLNLFSGKKNMYGLKKMCRGALASFQSCLSV